MIEVLIIMFSIRVSCAIEMTNHVIMTGGWPLPEADEASSEATVYNEQGWVEDLPNMNTGRWMHACGHYVNTNNQVVSAPGSTSNFITS